MSPGVEELAQECRREETNCLYTSVTLHIWLRVLRFWRVVFSVTPLILGTLAGWSVLKQVDGWLAQSLLALCALVAGLMPTVYNALKLDDQIGRYERLAAEFMNLRDRFRQAALIGSTKSIAEFESEFRPLMDRLEQARQQSLTPPEWVFERAQKKIATGDYDFDPTIDQRSPSIGGAGALPKQVG